MENTAGLTYAPGDWWVLAHTHGVALLHPSFEIGVVHQLWAEIVAKRPLVTWLDVVVRRELAQLNDFGLARFVDDQAELVIRGKASAEVDGVRLDAMRKVTWREEVLPARRVRLEGNHIETSTLPLFGGIVRAQSVTWQRDAVVSHAASAAEPRGYPEPVHAVPVLSAPEDSSPASAISAGAASPDGPGSQQSDDHNFIDGVPQNVTPVATVPRSALTGEQNVDFIEGRLRSLEDTWHLPSGEVESEPTDDVSVNPGQVREIELPDGSRISLDNPVLVGRAPEAPHDDDIDYQLVTVDSPQHDVSRTHVEISAEGSLAVVTDQRSINGTIIIEPGQTPRRLHAGEGVSVPAGTQIDIGDGVVLTIL